MLGQSFGPTLLMDQLGAQGPTGSHQAFQRLFTTSASWRSKPVPGHRVDDWVTGLPIVPAMSCHVQPFLGSSGFIFPHFSQAIFGRTSSLVSSIGQVDVHDAEMLFHVLDDGLGSKRRALKRTLLLSLPVGYGLKCQVPIPYHLLII